MFPDFLVRAWERFVYQYDFFEQYARGFRGGSLTPALRKRRHKMARRIACKMEMRARKQERLTKS